MAIIKRAKSPLNSQKMKNITPVTLENAIYKLLTASFFTLALYMLSRAFVEIIKTLN